MILFNEVRTLSEISQEAFAYFYNITSHKDSAARDILYICSTAEAANQVFSNIVRNHLGAKIFKSQRRIETPDGLNIYVRPIMMLSSWLPGRRFKSIIFER